ncbi:DUF4190 domain-containing protein [Ammonicoccus fulvus]|uniref:DUF4190 domain-containing protein n=1 Tax=Ammonicoccus fulvus TaxID=3138240 RepID=A0ABZ3FLF4_9ACTN
MSEPTSTYQPQQYGMEQRTNTLAIIALVGSFFISLVGIICGHLALNQIKQTGEKGRGLALAGLIIGYIGLVVGILYVVFAVILVANS